MTEFNKVILEGHRVRLEPLAQKHYQALCIAIADGKLWELAVTLVPQLDDVPVFIENAVAAYAAGRELAFATIDKASGKVVGSTRYMNINSRFNRVEIGFTFLGSSWQRTYINSEAKLLMLSHAFEIIGVNRVEFLTDELNQKSRQAIARLGAKEEGILRQHMQMPNGRIRNSVIFSIVKTEWPELKNNLENKLLI